jgi:hypothetical protein
LNAALEQLVWQDARERCGYCRAKQIYSSLELEIEHLHPQSAGGRTVRENLWLACRGCNLFKGSKVRIRDPLSGRLVRVFNPRTQHWKRHFRWDGPRVIGLTACGRATVSALSMNRERAVVARTQWMSATWHPPDDE